MLSFLMTTMYTTVCIPEKSTITETEGMINSLLLLLSCIALFLVLLVSISCQPITLYAVISLIFLTSLSSLHYSRNGEKNYAENLYLLLWKLLKIKNIIFFVGSFSNQNFRKKKPKSGTNNTLDRKQTYQHLKMIL